MTWLTTPISITPLRLIAALLVATVAVRVAEAII